jgi:hypothetical protein
MPKLILMFVPPDGNIAFRSRRQTKEEAARILRAASLLIAEYRANPYGVQEGKKVLDTIFEA